MLEIITELTNSIAFFTARGWCWLLWVFAVVWLWFRKEQYRDFLLVLITGTIALVNPVTGGLLLKIMDNSAQVYSRVFWLLMIEPVIAVAAVDFIRAMGRDVRTRMAVGVLVVANILAAGAYMYDSDTVFYMDNRMEVSGLAISVADYIVAHRESEKDRCVLGEDILSQVRQVDGSIRQYYGRRHEDKIEPLLEVGGDELETKLEKFRKRKVKFIVIPDKPKHTRWLLRYGWIKADRLADYAVYVPMDHYDNGWVVRSHVDASGQQGMFYTLERHGKLIIIDGGWDSNADQVRSVIKDYDNEVYAWFVTHYHNDHVDALNEILKDPGKIKIKQIYDTPLDGRYFHKHAKKWDFPESFDTYKKLTKGMENVKHLKRGDKFKVKGLSLEVSVFNAYDDIAKKNTDDDIANDASLVLKFCAGKNSMLFCADAHSKKLGKYLIKKYGDEMKADFVQAGHHGNNSFPIDFYRAIDPSVVIFDAPEWLMDGKKYTCKKLKSQLEKEGIEVLDYSTDPNYFNLEVE